MKSISKRCFSDFDAKKEIQKNIPVFRTKALRLFLPLGANLPCVLLEYYHVKIFDLNATLVPAVCQGFYQNFGVIPKMPEISECSAPKATVEKRFGPASLPIFLIAPVKGVSDQGI